jgi:prevent-host-death family protein
MPHKSVNIHQAKTHFSALIAEVQAGEEITIAKAGHPVARLVPIEPQSARRHLGWDVGQPYYIAPDFDEFIPAEFQEYM